MKQKTKNVNEEKGSVNRKVKRENAQRKGSRKRKKLDNTYQGGGCLKEKGEWDFRTGRKRPKTRRGHGLAKENQKLKTHAKGD